MELLEKIHHWKKTSDTISHRNMSLKLELMQVDSDHKEARVSLVKATEQMEELHKE